MVAKQLTQWRQIVQHQGFIHLRNFIPIDIVDTVRTQIIYYLRKYGWAMDQQATAYPHAKLPPRDGFYALMGQLLALEPIHRLCCSPYLLSLIDYFLGTYCFVHPRRMLRVRWPHHIVPHHLVDAHQDFDFVQGEEDTFTLWIPLGDYEPHEGGLTLLPHSHLSTPQLLEDNLCDPHAHSMSPELTDKLPWYRPHYHRGDVVIFHSLTIHRCSVNRSRKFRLSLDCRYSSSRGRISAKQLLPPYFPHLPTWQALTSTWRDKSLVDIPETVKVIPTTTRQTAASSRFLNSIIRQTSPSALQSLH